MNGPAFEPWERFMLLDRALDEVPPSRAADVLPIVTATAMVVVRQAFGKATKAEAYAAIARARDAVAAARRSA